MRPLLKCRLRRVTGGLAGALCLAAVGCGDDLVTPAPVAQEPVPTATASVFAYQLRGDPLIRLLAERSDHREIGLELDRALSALEPGYVGASTATDAGLASARQALVFGEKPDSTDGAEEAEILSAVLGLTVDRVTTILDQPNTHQPKTSPGSYNPLTSAER